MDYDLSNDVDIKMEPADSADSPISMHPIIHRGDTECNNSSASDDSSPDSGDGLRQNFSTCSFLNDADSSRQDYCSSTLFLEHENDDDDDKATSAGKRLCLVCGDVASGLHYGVASCEACKAFFKRTIQGHIEYSCPASGNCEITKPRRKACQACRFQKCLYMGMLREGVRPDRVRGGRQKYPKRTDYVPTTPVAFVQRSGKPVTSSGQMKKLNGNAENLTKIKVEQSKVIKSENKLLSALMRIEPEEVFATPDESINNGELKLMITLSDLTDRELVATIGWAKQVPGFGSLPLPDQMKLLHGTWLDIICLNIAFRSVPYSGVIKYAKDFQLSEDHSDMLCMPRDLDLVTRKMIEKMTRLKVERAEYLLLKAMLLFNPDACLDSLRSVQVQRDRVYDQLVDYVGGNTPSTVRRVSELLLMLPFLVQNKFICRDFWLKVLREKQVTLHKLLREMLEYVI